MLPSYLVSKHLKANVFTSQILKYHKVNFLTSFRSQFLGLMSFLMYIFFCNFLKIYLTTGKGKEINLWFIFS